MKRAVSLLLVVAMTSAAAADPHKVIILQSEGRADPKTRRRIDAAIVKLAKTGTDQIVPGEITYGDAAALVGCKPQDASCKENVIITLAVDEIVIVTVDPKPGGLEVSVRRIAKGSASREAITLVAADQPDKLDAVAPLFGAKVATTAPVTGPVGPTLPDPQPAITTGPTVGPELPPTTAPVTATPPEPTVTPTTSLTPSPSPVLGDDRGRNRHRLRIAGMAGGAGMFLLGIVLWSKASGIQSDVDASRPRNANELAQLRDLEARGDSYAGWGNFFGLGGLVLGGVSTYFYVRARRANRSSSTAWLAPTVFDHGAGVTLTIGGAR